MKVQFNLDTNEIDVIYFDQNHERIRIPVSQFSDGYKCTISLIADIAYRMAILNPQLLDKVLVETEGIILIDEIDLHLHPTWQKRILKDLTDLFPKVQLIVSTHAPEVINSAKSDSVLILKDNAVLRAADETYGKDANTGTFNGNGFEIIGLTMTNPNAEVVGLFGIAKNAHIYNVTMRDYDILNAGRDVSGKSVGAVLAVGQGSCSYDNFVYPKETSENESSD